MTQKVQAVVIKSNDTKEKDVNILLFSLEDGKIWATLKGVKNPKAKMKPAKNMFTFGEFVLEEGKSGNIVTGVEVIESFHEICEDVDKYFEASAVLEVVEKMEFSSEKERAQIFVLMVRTLKTICFASVRRLYVLDKFLIELFKSCGTPLFSDRCTCCKTQVFDRLYVNYAVGELVCVACKNPTCVELSQATYSALKILANTKFDRLSSIKLAKESEMSLLKILVKNFESRFDTKLKMMGVLA